MLGFKLKNIQDNRLEKDNITYILNHEEKTADILGINLQKDNILIPRSIIHNSTEYIIKRINSYAFRFSKIKSIQFPPDSEIKTLEDRVFDYSSIESFTIPPNLTNLSPKWAYGASNLKNVKVDPNNPCYKSYDDKTIIGKNSIEDEIFDVLVFCARDVTNFKIPKFIKRIGSFCFNGCKQLRIIEFEKDSELQIIEQFAFSGTSIENFTIPSSVTIICEHAFSLCMSIEEFEVPNNSQLQTIEKCAFNYTPIKSLKIPSKLIELKEGWCSGVTKLNRILVMPENPRFSCADGEFLFEKSSLENNVYDMLAFCPRDIQIVKIPSFTKIIGSFAFQKCKNIKTVDFSFDSNLQIIRSNAFSYSSIKRFTVPSKLIEIEMGAFTECNDLEFVEMNNDSKLKKIGEGAFKKSSIKCFKIPPSVENIEKYAFGFCIKLQIVEISENSQIKTIHQDVFADCKILIMVPKGLDIEFVASSTKRYKYKA